MSTRAVVAAGDPFDLIARWTNGGWEYLCDGMPRPQGCGESTVVTRRWSRVGTKSTGWLVIHGVHPDGSTEPSIVLAFCPSCAAVVRQQIPAATKETDHA